MVGAFWQPAGVLIDTRTLSTLPEREYRSGLAEVVKYGVILDADLFTRLERDARSLVARDPQILQQIVARCCQLKAGVVEADERETSGHREVLNYGHTFGHALEAITGYSQLLHGEAVSIGMMCAARLAERLGQVDAAFVTRQQTLLGALRLPVALPAVSEQQMLTAMLHDKKVQGGQLRFVLPDRLGHVQTVADIDSALVAEAVRRVGA
jgi:3-dehydroquinate synthase